MTYYHDEALLKECMWAVSNIAAGTVEHVRSLLESPLVDIAIDNLTSAGKKVKKESMWVVSNITSNCIYDITEYVVNKGVILKVCNLLETDGQYDSLTIVCLEALKNIIRSGNIISQQGEVNPFKAEFEKYGGVDIVTKLEGHQMKEIAELAEEVLVAFNKIEEVLNGGENI